jgi:Domain of unknown function (DUF1816)
MNSIPLKKAISENISTTSNELMWWTKVYTKVPFCIYYFGPFNNADDAKNSRFGYIEDLENEGSTVVFIRFLQLNPQHLTVEYENLSWVRWLHEMMQDSLRLKVLCEPEALPSSSRTLGFG